LLKPVTTIIPAELRRSQSVDCQ